MVLFVLEGREKKKNKKFIVSVRLYTYSGKQSNVEIVGKDEIVFSHFLNFKHLSELIYN